MKEQEFSEERQNVVKLFLGILNKDKKLAEKLENAIFKRAQIKSNEMKLHLEGSRFVKVYINETKHIYSNIANVHDVNNDYFQKAVHDLSEEELIEIQFHDMHPERWKSLFEKKKQNINEAIQEPEYMTSEYTCSKCKRKKCHFREEQIRSCDEPTTIFLTCCHCGHSWKM